MEEIRTKNPAKNFIPAERPLAIYIPISTSFRPSLPPPPPKEEALFIPWKECSIMQRDFRLSSVHASERRFLRRALNLNYNIPRQVCVVNRGSGLLLPRLLLPGRKLRLTGFVKGKENSQG